MNFKNTKFTAPEKRKKEKEVPNRTVEKLNLARNKEKGSTGREKIENLTESANVPNSEVWKT